MRNPVIVMAMWGRQELVKVNLRQFSEPCTVAVVASLSEDIEFLRSLRMPNLQIIPASNTPLGAKWQVGVDAARSLGADPLIILGSDDFLSTDFVKKAVDLSTAHDFVFFDRWYIFDRTDRKYYQLDYQMDRFRKPPLGSGRIYSRRFLESHAWRLFDVSMNSRLDDFAWDNHREQDRLLKNPEGLSVLALKGTHETMNPLNAILSSPTIRWKEVAEVPDFGFTPHQTF